MEGARRRGRWKSMDSVQRYSKTFALTKYRSRMPEKIRAEGEDLCKDWRGSVLDALAHSKSADSALARHMLAFLKNHATADTPWDAASEAITAVESDDDGWNTE